MAKFLLVIVAMIVSAMAGSAAVAYYGPIGWLVLILNGFMLGFAPHGIEDTFS